jgi:hypothetical protein
MFAAWQRWQQSRGEFFVSPEVARILEADAQKQQVAQRPPEPPAEPPKVDTGPRFHLYRARGIETITTGMVGSRMIRGIASTPTICSRRTEDGKTKKWRLKSSGCMARFPIPLKCDHHELGQIGDVTLVNISPQQVVIHGLIWDTDPATYAWENLIKTGAMRCLSAGALATKRTVVDEIGFLERWLLEEVSIVRVPANPDCTFEVMKDVR